MTAELVKDLVLKQGFQSVGIAAAGPPESSDVLQAWLDRGYAASMDWMHTSVEARNDLNRLLPGAKSVVACAMNYSQPNDPVPGYPRIARYALGRDYHKVLRGRLHAVRRALADAEPEHQHRVCVDSAPLLEREWAHTAGLGWYGKNTLLIDSKRGSWTLLGFVLTTLDLSADSPSEGGCGTCRACIDACPTGAIVEHDDVWQIDSRKCISYLTIEHDGEIGPELQPQMGDWTFGCDACQEVCPFNQPRESQPDRAQFTEVEDFLKRRPWPSLKELAEISEEDWDELTRGSAVRRAGWEGLRRNARINLKNRA
jgi:epoxyqueuosine reductase